MELTLAAQSATYQAFRTNAIGCISFIRTPAEDRELPDRTDMENLFVYIQIVRDRARHVNWRDRLASSTRSEHAAEPHALRLVMPARPWQLPAGPVVQLVRTRRS